MSVFGEIERMIGAGVCRLQVAQEGIDGSELLHLRTGGTAARHGALMCGADTGALGAIVLHWLCKSAEVVPA